MRKLRKIVFSFCCVLLLAFSASAQTTRLYALTSAYSWDSAGTIFNINNDGSGFTTPRKFSGQSGSTPFGGLVQANNGKLYGMTYQGGSNATINYPEGTGVIFSFDTGDSAFTVIHNFDSINGAQPFGNLIQANDGKLYGMTSGGGSANLGVIFSINPDGSDYTKWVDFNGTNGYFPQGTLMQAGNGLLYGMTSGDGGAGNFFGTIFSYTIGASAVNLLWTFDGNDTSNAGYPVYGHLVEMNNRLYGMASQGSTHWGVIFGIDLDGANYRQWGFDGLYGPNDPIPKGDVEGDGGNPYGSLIIVGDKLFGMTQAGGITHNSPFQIGYGTVFSFDPAQSAITYLHKFDTNRKGQDGFSPYGDLVLAKDGKLYGLTLYSNRADNNGIAFSISQNGDDYEIIHDFGDGIGHAANPYGSFIEANLVMPSISVNTPEAICAGGNGVILTAACSANCTNITYTWAPAAGLNFTTGATVTANPSVTTTYTVTGINSDSETSKVVSVVTVKDAAVAGTISSDRNFVCLGTPAILSVTGNSSIVQWQSSLSPVNFTDIQGATAGTYTAAVSQTTNYRVYLSNGSCTDTSAIYTLTAVNAPSGNFTGHVAGNTVTFNSGGIEGATTYSWDFGDNSAASSEANPTHVYATAPDTFNVCLTAYNGSNCSFTICKDVSIVTGIALAKLPDAWKIYPNPVNNNLSISTGYDMFSHVEISDVLGRLIVSIPVTTTPANTLIIDVSALNAGIYFIKIKTKETNYRQKIIKQ